MKYIPDPRGSDCIEFVELMNSDIVDIRGGCVVFKARGGGTSGCTDNVGPRIRVCPFCGKLIHAEYSEDDGHWSWWHC